MAGGPKVALHFFQHKYQSRERGIESGGESGPRPSCGQGKTVALVKTQFLRNTRANRAAHLHRWSLAAQC